jgi:hypothetical protein
MSFGISVSDVIVVTQLAWNIVQGAKKACGELAELTREVSGIHKILRRLQNDLDDPESLLGRNGQNSERRAELAENFRDCHHPLKLLNSVLTKYNSLSEHKRCRIPLYQKILFGNGEMLALSDIRLQLLTHTSAISINLQQISLGSQGRIELILNNLQGDFKGMRKDIDFFLAMMTAWFREGSVLSSRVNDEKQFWEELQRNPMQHNELINDHVTELGNRGIFDESPGLSEVPTPADFITAESESTHPNTFTTDSKNPSMFSKTSISRDENYVVPSSSHDSLQFYREISDYKTDRCSS